VVHYVARHGENRVSKAAIISAVPPLMVQTPANPKGLPKKVFDDFQVASSRRVGQCAGRLPHHGQGANLTIEDAITLVVVLHT
jgi:hypothetical protein